ncbi:hypothetical protein Tco_0500273 [Tanacetum coccineum]
MQQSQPLIEFPQTLPSVQPTSCTRGENPFTYDSKPNFVDDSPNVFNPPPQPPIVLFEFWQESDARYGSLFEHSTYGANDNPYVNRLDQIRQKKEEERRIAEEQVAKDRYWKIPICYDDDDDYTIAITPCVWKCLFVTILHLSLKAFKEHSETIIDSNNDYSSSDDDSYENIDYVDASPPDAEILSLEVVEIVIPEVRGIDTDILLTIKDDILHEKLLNVNLLIANIEALKDNPTPSSDVMTKSSSTSLNLFLEETNTFDNSLIESFCFNLEEISSGSTTTRSDYSLPDYKAFYSDDDHIKEKSSGSTTTHANFS